VAAGDHGVERPLDPVAIFLGNGERRQQLDGVAAVAGDLRQDFLVLKQRHRDELAEQALLAVSSRFHDAFSRNDFGGPNSTPS